MTTVLQLCSHKFRTLSRGLSLALLATGMACFCSPAVFAIDIRITIENIGPANGVAITPVWVGLHDGSFDSYDGGSPAAPFLESLAEDGDNTLISAEFNTVVDGRVDATIGSPTGPPPLSAGESASIVLSNVAIDGSNRYFSYASMILPSNDFFVANGNPMQHDLMSLYDGAGSISFLIGTTGNSGNSPVHDAGTEEEDFDFVAPGTGPLQNVLFPGRGFADDAGQTGPNQGPLDATTVISNVTGLNPFADFLNINGADLSGFDFNNPNLYTGGGIARITITVVPEPSTVALSLFGVTALGMISRRRKK